MAVTLPDGDVLVAGGFTSSATLSSAERYDPQTGRWSQTGAMALGRSNATLTVLANGKVLVAGGLTSVAPGVTAKAEIFDPATGRWSITGKMLVPRANHTATLLQNGDVLVAGGVGLELNQSVGMAGAELYDPTTGTWSRTGAMSTQRERHTAALLADGEVLVTGGNIDYLKGPQGSTETYNPATGRWSFAGHMTTSRFSQTATVLADGTVLVAGGSYGYFVAWNTVASSDRYNPTTRRWSPTGDMQIAVGSIPTISGRELGTATLLSDGRVLVAGGDGFLRDFTSFATFSSAELYDSSVGTWSLTASMMTPRTEHAAARLADGRVLVMGGSGSHANVLASTEIFTPSADRTQNAVATNTFGAAPTKVLTANKTLGSGISTAPLMSAGRAARSLLGGIATTSHRGYAIRPSITPRDSIGTWSPTGAMHVARTGAPPAILLPNGKVLIEGCDSVGTTAELYDPVKGTWSFTGSMHVPRCGHAAILLRDGRVLVAGGSAPPNVWSNVEFYDPRTGNWTLRGRMNSTRFFTAIVMLQSGEVLNAAGAAINTDPRDSADLFDPATGRWTATPSLNLSRWNYGAAPLPDGKVLVTGGFTQDNSLTLTSELYDPATNNWRYTGSTEQQPGPGHVVALLTGEVLATDEPGNGPTGTTSELYDQATGKWTPTLGKMHFPRANDAVTELTDGRVLISGGCYGISCVFIAQAELYQPASQKWNLDAPLVTPRYDHSAVLLADGRVLVAGGYDAHLQPLTTAEVYTPSGTARPLMVR